MVSPHSVFQVVITSVHMICATEGIDDIYSPALFERELSLQLIVLTFKLLSVRLNFTLVKENILPVVSHKAGQLWWGSKSCRQGGDRSNAE